MLRLWILSPLLVTLISCQLLRPASLSSQPPQHQLFILQGATDTTSTQINILAPAKRLYTFQLKMENSTLEAPQPFTQDVPGTAWQLYQLQLKDLTSELLYSLQVFDEEHKMVDSRFFKVLPKKIQKPRIFIVSCTNDAYTDLQKKQWAQIEQQKPDFLFMIGDNVYADVGPLGPVSMTPELLWKRYTETWSTLALYKMLYLVPTYAIWDDHDYGINDGNMTFPYKNESLNVLKNFFPMRDNDQLTSGPGASAQILIGNQQFLFLDNRFFRTPAKTNPQSHFGKEQGTWMLEKVKNHDGLTWLISGDQFFGGYHPFESFEGNHPQDFKSFLKSLKSLKHKVVFVSGDRHAAEVMKVDKKELGYTTYEFTSSGLHSKMYQDTLTKHTNPRSIFGKGGESNYMSLEIDDNLSPAKIGVVIWGEDMKVYYQNFFEIGK